MRLRIFTADSNSAKSSRLLAMPGSTLVDQPIFKVESTRTASMESKEHNPTSSQQETKTSRTRPAGFFSAVTEEKSPNRDPLLVAADAQFLLKRFKKFALELQGTEWKHDSGFASVSAIFPTEAKLNSVLREVKEADHKQLFEKMSQALLLPLQIYFHNLIKRKVTLDNMPAEIGFFLLNQKVFLTKLNAYSNPILPDLATLASELRKQILSVIQKKDQQDQTALMLACEQGHREAVRFICLNSPEVAAAVSRQGRTALQIAFERQNLDVLELLVYYAPDAKQLKPIFDYRNELGQTNLMVACLNKDINKIRCLITVHKASHQLLDGVDAKGRTTLVLAAQHGNAEIIELLVKKAGMDPNIQDSCGWTPLMYAARSGKLDIVTALIRLGAKPGIENSTHSTALEIALHAQQREISDYLDPLTERSFLRRFLGP